jgi:hypothetical protein
VEVVASPVRLVIGVVVGQRPVVVLVVTQCEDCIRVDLIEESRRPFARRLIGPADIPGGGDDRIPGRDRVGARNPPVRHGRPEQEDHGQRRGEGEPVRAGAHGARASASLVHSSVLYQAGTRRKAGSARWIFSHEVWAAPAARQARRDYRRTSGSLGNRGRYWRCVAKRGSTAPSGAAQLRAFSFASWACSRGSFASQSECMPSGWCQANTR